MRYIDKSKRLFLTRLDESIKNPVITCSNRDRVARRQTRSARGIGSIRHVAVTLIPREHEISAAT